MRFGVSDAAALAVLLCARECGCKFGCERHLQKLTDNTHELVEQSLLLLLFSCAFKIDEQCCRNDGGGGGGG